MEKGEWFNEDDHYAASTFGQSIPKLLAGHSCYQGTDHLLTHKPKDPKCPACMIAKMERRPVKRLKGLDEEKIKKFGDSITLDHISLGENWGKFPYALTILDRATGFRMAYPVKHRNEEETEDKIKRFVGQRKITRA